MLAYVLQGLTLGVSGAAVPGPLQAFLLSQTLRYGWKRALPAATAPLFSDGPIVALVLFALTQLPAQFLMALRFAGGLFLLYLAWDAYRARHAVDELTISPATRPATGFWKAVMTNFLNPNPYIFWSILAGPILLSGWQESAWHGVGFVLGMYGALVGGLGLFVWLVGVAAHQSARVRRALVVFSALALLAFGLFQLGWVALNL